METKQLDFRFRLLREKKYIPAIVLGWTPPGSVSPVMAHDYLVVTKNFLTGIGNFQVTGGYGSPFVIRKNSQQEDFLKSLELREKSDYKHGNYLTGFFGGLSYMPVSFGGIMLEYDTRTFNA
ncbi:YjbH domain-containing protein [Antarcticibacterium sp. 1MA-6-2]|uniref:YjbH domain-containing protein n=1 Tax=Antarcticibacterium sp. 1MA-6-2 TaxID=2908210 RepID=UPI001F38A1DA|nr:YjbH domain-containing protein [Antarcticibacterium sp. 1MA-6-2]UJH89860.1 YjbH domain-containing protein [Antarcticibacterium sp. 1MA-6-2]